METGDHDGPSPPRPAQPDRYEVILPAGGRLQGDFAQRAGGVDVKALIAFEGRTLLRRVLEALRESGRVGRLIVIGPEAIWKEARDGGADVTLPEGDSGPENIFRGMAHLHNPHHPALIATTDLPFLTPEAVRWVLASSPAAADIAVPLVTREDFDAVFPGCIRTETRLADGWFRLGGLFLFRPQTLLRSRPHLERVFAARKSDLQMARLIGLRTALKYVTRRLTVRDIAQRASQILGCRGVPLLGAPAELAFDIDLPEEYLYAREYLARQATARTASAPPAPPEETAR